MKAHLGRRSKLNLCEKVDYRLVQLATEVSQRDDLPCDFGVFETKRTIEKQRNNVKKGVSKTMNSKHIPNKLGVINAMDIVPYVKGIGLTWNRDLFDKLIPIFKEVAEKNGYLGQLTFGYDWGWDCAHIEVKANYQVK